MYTAVSLLLAFLASFALTVHCWVYAGIIGISSSFFIYGSATVCSGFYLQVLCAGKTRDRLIALSFDDGPDPQLTPVILDILKERNIQAAFFCVGSKVEANHDLADRINTEGHLLGNHSYSHHYWFDLFSVKKMKSELEKTRDIIFQATGRRVRLFRPPYGVTNPNLARAVGTLGFTAIGWSLRSKDTVIREEKSLLERLKKRISPGDVILLHDTSVQMAAVLEELIDWVSQNHFRIVRLDHMLNIRAYD